MNNYEAEVTFDGMTSVLKLTLSHYMPWRSLWGKQVQLLLILDLDKVPPDFMKIYRLVKKSLVGTHRQTDILLIS
jgi:hypothetical protein